MKYIVTMATGWGIIVSSRICCFGKGLFRELHTQAGKVPHGRAGRDS